MAKLPEGLKVTTDSVNALERALALLPRREVLVGFPEETTDREEDDGSKSPMTNATLGYVHDNGSPEVNIPARPFMIPGMQRASDEVVRILKNTAVGVLKSSDPSIVDKGFTRAGAAVQASMRQVISDGIPPPLADSTLRAKARKKIKGAAHELAQRAAGEQPSTEFVKPLIETGEMRRSINFVIRTRRAGTG